MSSQRIYDTIFKPPMNRDVSVWRYMNIEKLEWLLIHKALYFTKVSDFPDQLEGTLTGTSERALKVFFHQHGSQYDPILENQIEIEFKQSTFACCWAKYDEEKLKLWEEFDPTGCGVAIKSTFQSLDDVVSDRNGKRHVGVVRYIMDRDTYHIPTHNMFYRFMHKDSHFGFEQEVRAIISGELGDKNQVLPINIDVLIHGIFVNPNATEEQYRAIENLFAKYAQSLSPRLQWSSLRGFTILD